MTTRSISIVSIVAIALCGFASQSRADSFTWSLFKDFSATSSPASQSRSLRGLAVSSDSAELYAGFIQGSSSARTLELNTSTAAVDAFVTLGGTGFYQAKGVATDDRGYVYVTRSSGANAAAQRFAVYNSNLAQSGAFTSTVISTAASSSQFAGASVAKIGSQYYLYLARNKGSNAVSGSTIERWNVTNTAAAPVLDTSFGTSGFLSIKSLTGNVNAFVNGLEVASDGTIYATGGTVNSATVRGDSVFKIAPSLTSYSAVSINQAMDLALYNGDIYVTSYAAASSGVTVLKQSDLLVDPNVTLNLPPSLLALHTNADLDSGFSGITIAADGTIYLADQEYKTVVSNTEWDRILVATPVVPTPTAALGGLLLIGGIFIARRKVCC